MLQSEFTTTPSFQPQAPVTTTSAPSMAPSQPIIPPQPIPFIPMVPPLANTFTTTHFQPTVTSALVDNLINNNPTQSFAPTTVTTSSVQGTTASENEANANTSAIDSLASTTASQLFISSNATNEFIRNEQNIMAPPSSIPAMYQTSAAPPTSVNQQFVQAQGLFLKLNLFKTTLLLILVTSAASPSAPVPAYNVPMYSLNQFNNYPMQQPPVSYPSAQPPTDAHHKLEQAFAPPTMSYGVSDPNQNQQTYQQFQPASTQFNLPAMPIQTFEAYPQQVQTQINLQGLPPLTVNTPRIDPTKYS